MSDWVWVTLWLAFVSYVVYSFASRPARRREQAERAIAGAEPPPKAQLPRTNAKPQANAKPATATAKAAKAATAPAATAEPLEPAPDPATSDAALPRLGFEAEDEDVEATELGNRAQTSMVVKKIVYDEDAAMDEPTHSGALILVSATGQTDPGLRRKRNEDSMLVLEKHGLFVVADGMGGHRGGALASALAVTTMQEAFETQTFEGERDVTIPTPASELARAIHMANDAILTRADADREFEGMGTTLCAARFSSNKQRLYVGHVGDSRVYCLRAGTLRQMTSDHTMADLGVSGAGAEQLSRAVGVWPSVPVDMILGKPRAGDVYLLCSDGLTKMVGDAEIERILVANEPQPAADKLVEAAKAHGGKDNVTVVVVWVTEPHAAPKSCPPSARSSDAA